MHPYMKQPARARWKPTVSAKNPLDISNWYRKKFDISDGFIATGGSCFAQHIGKNLMVSGFKYLDVEPAPNWLDDDLKKDLGYGIYSARYGNIYSPKQLL